VRQHRETPPDATAGLWFVDAGDDRAVLKLIRLGWSGDSRWPAAPGVEHPYYWRREALAYESGLLYDAPRCRAVVDRADGTTAIWLDALAEQPPWTPERLGTVARRVGAAQAAPPPDEPWLARGWLRMYLELHGVAPTPVLDRLEAMPQTFCHHDLHPGNVLGRIIDWAYCGYGAPGTDPGVLVADGIADEAFPADRADEVAAAVWSGYLEGLGGAFDEDDVRFAFVHGTALRLSWLPRGRRPAWDATIDFLERLASDA
jgi:Phosphotransferase enzyme family